jgi:hypothetical protein
MASVVAALLVILVPGVRRPLGVSWRYFGEEHASRTVAWLLVLVLVLTSVVVITIRRARPPAAPATTTGRKADRALLAKLISLLPSNVGTIEGLRSSAFTSFRYAVLDPLRTFEYDWDNAEYEFHDSEIEAARVELLDAVKDFSTAISLLTVPDDAGREMQVVPREWKTGDGSTYLQAVNELGDKGMLVVARHQVLVRLARSLLED